MERLSAARRIYNFLGCYNLSVSYAEAMVVVDSARPYAMKQDLPGAKTFARSYYRLACREEALDDRLKELPALIKRLERRKD